MIAAWMLYCIGIAVAFVVVGEALERALHLARRATRWAWVAALAGSYALPAAAWLRPSAFAGLPVPLAGPVAAGASVSQRVGPPLPPPTRPFSLGDLDAALTWAWGLSAGAVALALLGAGLRLAAWRRRWRVTTLDGRTVLVSDNVGPAVVGVWRPQVVLPAWSLELRSGERRLMLLHEDEHVRARDPWLRAAGAALLALAPWNPALWWQVRRLRLAVEMDCDARVLARGGDTPEYAELLLRVGERRARLPLGAAALGEPVSFLGRRIRRLVTDLPRWRWAGATAAGCIAAAAVAVACEAPRPVGLRQETRAGELVYSVFSADAPVSRVRTRAFAESTTVATMQAITQHYPELLREPTGPRVEVWFVADSRNRVVRTLKRPGPDVITVGIPGIRAVFPELDPSNVYGWSVHQVPEFRGMLRDNVRVIWIGLRAGADHDSALSESSIDERPVFLSGPPLQYPPLLRQAGIQGTVMVRAIIDTTGRAEPASVQVVESPHPGFNEAARNAVLQARFRHGRFRGRAVRVQIEFPVEFRTRG
ncbi:MAG TPA: M56 family metallopeptidase [Gemmatimonadales bacterium]|jgi:TonB family protein